MHFIMKQCYLGAEGKVKLNLDLPYTRAVIQEGFRIRPVGPFTVPRKTTKDVILMGYHIPKNTQVIVFQMKYLH